MTGQPKGHTLFVYTTCTGDIRHLLRDLQRACNTMEETNERSTEQWDRKICNEDMGGGGLNVPPYSVYECRIYTVSQTDESLNIFSNMNYGVTF